jgi:hypothetical protein
LETTLETTIEIIEPRKNYSFCVSECAQEDSQGNIHQFMRLPNIKRDQKLQKKN